MKEIFSKEAVLLLKDGTLFKGKAMGKIGTTGIPIPHIMVRSL
jgi:hypothetical protein